ncbi:virulence-associated E family protein [Mesorhizobium sp. M0220]|uniref:virulence-associated E family protein n=1 Tax=Mesorhizobium sp. M0220 TaxID=2956920 RepID=UPI00333D0182
MTAQSNVAYLQGDIRFDLEVERWLTANKRTIRRNLLSDTLEIHDPSGSRPLSDDRLSEIRFSFAYATNGKDPAKDKVADALALIGERRSYHPVRDYLDGLQWDGVKRLDALLCRYAGASDTSLHRAFGRKIICAAVRRAKLPGCKFDHVIVLQGRQDLGKSSLIRALCADPAWFTDQAKVGADAKETIERTAGAWVVELAELDGLGRREANAVKSFVTTVCDRARPAHGRYTVERPRGFVLFGTTNESAFLADLTGNRRWWAVLVTFCDVAGLTSVRDQLWAEAVQVEPTENLWLDNETWKAEAAAATGAVIDHGPWFEVLAERIPEGQIKITVLDAWGMVGIDGNGINKISPALRANLRKAMTGLGFDLETKNLRRYGKQARAFLRGDADASAWWSPSDPLSR